GCAPVCQLRPDLLTWRCVSILTEKRSWEMRKRRIEMYESSAPMPGASVSDMQPDGGAGAARLIVTSGLANVSDEGWHISGASLFVVLAPNLQLDPEPLSPSDEVFWAHTRTLGDRRIYQITERADVPTGRAIVVGEVLPLGTAVAPEHPLRELPTVL